MRLRTVFLYIPGKKSWQTVCVGISPSLRASKAGNVGHHRVGRLMRENGIRVERSKKYKMTTDSNHAFNIAPNLLNRDFSADNPNQKWAGDISYVWTREGWLYLAVILDLHSRRVIGWAVNNRMKRDLTIRALNMAIVLDNRRKVASIIRTAEVSIALTITRSCCASMASRCR